VTLKQLYAAIRAGRYRNSDNIYFENDRYFVVDTVLIETPERAWVNTVEGFRIWHQL
jgi:hypothetical protein